MGKGRMHRYEWGKDNDSGTRRLEIAMVNEDTPMILALKSLTV